MKNTICFFAFPAVALLTLAAGSTAVATPLPGQQLKFQQVPMVATPVEGQVYFGHDEESTLYNLNPFVDPNAPAQFPVLYHGNYVADDFADEARTPVVHVRWWGSFLESAAAPTNIPIDKFLITFERDVPLGDPTNVYDFSHPGNPILNQVVTRGPLAPGSGTFEDQRIHPGGPPLNEELIEYNAELACPFPQEPDAVYWLKIAALVDVKDFNGDGVVDFQDLALAPRWGWHNRDYTIPDPLASMPPLVNPGEDVAGMLADGTTVWHFQDDAVAGAMDAQVLDPADPCLVDVNQLLSTTPIVPNFIPQLYQPGVDGPTEIGRVSKDLAFELWTVPEPSTLLLAVFGLLALCGWTGRR